MTRLSTGYGESCSSSPRRVGRDGELTLRFARRADATVLASSRFTPPLQVIRSVALGDGSAYLMLLNSGGGLVGGDRLATHIRLESQAHACLTTASATKVYRTVGEPATQQTAIDVEAGAVLEYLPDHVIPYAGSALRQALRVAMAPTSRAIIADGFAAGRVGRGERWEFALFDSAVNVCCEGRPVYFNRTRIVPRISAPAGPGIAQGFNYVGTLLVLAGRWAGWEALEQALNERLDASPAVLAGTSLLARDGCVVRLLTRTATELAETTRALWTVARKSLLGLDKLDLRKT